MGYIQDEGRNQATLFPVVLDDFVPADHVCRVIDAFVEMLVMSELGFERAQAAETGRPGYDPPDFVEAVSLRLSEPDSLVSALGS
jgi:transposase